MFPSGWVVNTLKEVVLVNDKKLKEEKEKKKKTDMSIYSWLSQRIKGGVQERKRKVFQN